MPMAFTWWTFTTNTLLTLLLPIVRFHTQQCPLGKFPNQHLHIISLFSLFYKLMKYYISQWNMSAKEKNWYCNLSSTKGSIFIVEFTTVSPPPWTMPDTWETFTKCLLNNWFVDSIKRRWISWTPSQILEAKLSAGKARVKDKERSEKI